MVPIELLQVVELLHEGVIVHGPDGVCIYANQGAADATGVPLEALRGATDVFAATNVRRPDHSPLPLAEFPPYAARLTKQPVHRHRASTLMNDGSYRELLISALPLLSAEGELRSVVVSLQDISRELTVVHELRAEQSHGVRARTLLSEAFALADVAVLERDLEGGTTFSSSRLRELLELEAHEGPPTGATLDGFVAETDRERYRAYLSALVTDEPGAPLDLRLHTAKGLPREVRLWGRRTNDEQGRRELVVLQDITEHRLVEAKLRLTERLTSLGTMAAGVAHEINNPLAFVTSNLNVVKGELSKLPPTPGVDVDDLRDAVDEALEGAERVRQIVLGLKPFARVDEHRRGPCDVPRVVEAALNMANNELRHRARIVKHLRQVSPVFANEARLGQVFVNLLVNAAHAMPDGRADENVVTVSTREQDGQIVVTISDTGHGIAPEVLPRIFDPFYSTKQIGEGTGLGLFISQGIVKEVGGIITVHSTPQVGTSFEVHLPMAPGLYAGSSPTPPPTRRRTRVLLVDDEPTILRALQRLLGKAHDLTLANSGRQALALLQAGLEYDLVLCDVMMPEVSGVDVWEQLDEGQRARVVFMTGGTFTERARRFLDESGAPVLEKPFTATTLEGLLQRVQTR